MQAISLRVLFSLTLVALTPGLLACLDQKPTAVSTEPTWQKITFDWQQISPEGLVGPADGRRSVSYEFCIPAQAAILAEVQAIDPTMRHYRSQGRIGCRPDQYLCIGHTHQPNWRGVLTSLVQRSYIQRIDEFFGE
jgi:hypothetical protein